MTVQRHEVHARKSAAIRSRTGTCRSFAPRRSNHPNPLVAAPAAAKMAEEGSDERR